MSEKEDVGPTCLYKNGESDIFEGGFVAKALKDGWSDEPSKKKAPKSKAKVETPAED